MAHVSRFPRFLKPLKSFSGLSLVLIGFLVPVLTVACSGAYPTSASRRVAEAQQSRSSTVPVTNTLEVSRQGPLGNHLVDSNGMTLYLFTNDEHNTSNCSGGCADIWPPLIVDGELMAGEGLIADLLAVVQREDGSSQATYDGSPLYHFANDKARGDTLGQEVGGVWYLVSPDGSPVRTTDETGTKEPGDY
jgi:predicted lipoprotein with Yx(FWY)xxD motif